VDSGQVIVWEQRNNPTDDSSNIGIIIGAVVGGVVLVAIGAVIFWRYRKNKKDKSLLT
jgi:LPXTG-motif cell wall-anchored protein